MFAESSSKAARALFLMVMAIRGKASGLVTAQRAAACVYYVMSAGDVMNVTQDEV